MNFQTSGYTNRLVSIVLVEIDEKWTADTKAYIKWNSARMPDPRTPYFPDIRLLNRAFSHGWVFFNPSRKTHIRDRREPIMRE